MLEDIKQILNGAWVRTVGGIRDVGEILYAIVGDPEGGEFFNKESGDVWIHSQDPTPASPTGKETSRLFFPLNAFFRLPKKGDAGVVLRPQGVAGPGHAMLMHGDGGGPDNEQVPDWLDENTCGIQVDKEELRIIVTGSGKKIKIETDGTVPVEINGNSYSALKTETQLTSLAGLGQAIGTVLSSASDVGIVAAMAAPPTPPINDPSGAPYPTNSAAIIGLFAAAAPYKTAKLKYG